MRHSLTSSSGGGESGPELGRSVIDLVIWPLGNEVSALLAAHRPLGGDLVGDLVRESVRMLMRELIETERSERSGASRSARTDSRQTDRHGSRPRQVATPAGDDELAAPQANKDSFFSSILDPRRPIDQSLAADSALRGGDGVLRARCLRREASTAWSRRLVADSGISVSEVSWICSLYETIGAFRTRTPGPRRVRRVYLDATFLHVAIRPSQVVSKVVVVATGVSTAGEREIFGPGLGPSIGDSEDEVFWKGPKVRGLGKHGSGQDRGLFGCSNSIRYPSGSVT
jgi:transposase-like protein